ncbi:MAG TPA: RlpA-like double-psi beta-barrel domain-containing protein [Hyphomicrobium sp.]|nr:RlpA-like double-psi beta-barrel domain-containing protein [Hyphomicrobium sp.]
MAVAVLAIAPSAAEAKTPGKTYCFNGICHRVNTLQEMSSLVGRDVTFKTSFYDDCKRDRYNPCGLTSSGEVFHPNDADNAASPIYPNGTVLLLRNPSNGESAVVRVNNAGPYWGKRKLDVSRATAVKLGFKKQGVAALEVRVIAAPTKEEAKYKKNRRYEAVPGPIGQFASIGAAMASRDVMIAMGTAPAKPIQVAQAESVAASSTQISDSGSPADALKAEARRFYGTDFGMKRIVVAPTMTAEIAPIHRSRPRPFMAQ